MEGLYVWRGQIQTKGANAELDGVAWLTKHPPPANSTALHISLIMFNGQDTSSVIAYPPGTHPISYGLGSKPLWVPQSIHQKTSTGSQVASST